MTAEQSRTGLNRAIKNVMMIIILTAVILCCCMLTCHADDTYKDEYGVTWTYEIAVYDTNPVIIKGCDNVPDGVLHIPAEIEGKAPEVIWMEAFMDNTAIRSIELPDSITNIGREAFYGCSSLQSLECPAELIFINQNAFGGCTSLKEVKLNSKLHTICNNAFNGCSSLTSVTIPAGVKSIEPEAFIACTSLTSINIEDGNSNYSSQDGVLYTNGLADLHTYPAGKTDSIFYVPEGVTTICAAAFDSTKVEHVVLPDTVTSIEINAFSDNSSLKDVYIPASVKTIDGEAFASTPAGFEIYAEAGSTAAVFASNHNIITVSATLAEYEQAVQESQGGGTGGGNEEPGGGDQPGGNEEPGGGNQSGGNEEPGGGDQPGGNDEPSGGDQPSSGEGTGTGNTDTNHAATNPAATTPAAKPASTAVKKAAAKTAAIKLSRPRLKAKNLKGRKVKLTWSKVKGADGYMIYVKGPKDKKYKLRLTKSARVKSITHKGLKWNKKYRYKVVAYKLQNEKKIKSKFSKVRTVKIRK